MDWSHKLLDGADRALFDQLGVFHGGFTAEAVAGVRAGFDELGVLDALRRLIDKSLLVADTRDSVTRYRMLETVREYAVARLAASDDAGTLRDRHLAVYLSRAASVRHLRDTDMDAWRAAIGADYENYRAAIAWGLSREDPEPGRAITAELAWFWHYSRHGREGMDLLRQAISLGAGGRTETQGRLLTGLALVADTTAPMELDYDVAGAGFEIATEAGDRRTACLALSLSGVHMLATDFQAAWNLADESDALAREAGFGFVGDSAYVLKGIVSHLRDDHQEAMRLLRTGADGLVRRHDRGVASTALGFLAISAAHTGDLSRARAMAEEAIRVATPLGDYHRVGTAHTVLAHVEGLAGRMDEAWTAMAPVLRLIERAESPPFVPEFAQRIAYLHLWSGEPERALSWFERELAVFGGFDATFLAPRCRIGLATALHRTGDAGAAEEQATIALKASREFGAPGLVADALAVLAQLAADTDPRHAENLHHEALASRAEHGLLLSCVDSLEALAALADRSGAAVEAARIVGACEAARARLGYPGRHEVHAGDQDAREAGRAMTLDEAVAYVRRSRGARSRPSTGWASLTPAERSVVELAAGGLSNPEIGQRLFMSRATVKTHLSHVYAKLGIANRTQLAAMAERDPN